MDVSSMFLSLSTLLPLSISKNQFKKTPKYSALKGQSFSYVSQFCGSEIWADSTE